MRLAVPVAVVVLLAVACGGRAEKAQQSDAGLPPVEVDAGIPFPAPFSAPPQVTNSLGPILAAPRFVPVFFAGDDANTVAAATDFLSKVGATDYWKTAGMEYGVGPATSTDAVMLPMSSLSSIRTTSANTIDDSAIQNWLAGMLNADNPAVPAADANTVYVLFFPSQITITIASFGGQTSASCQTFGGYHSDLSLNSAHQGINVSYAVIPRCSSFGDLNGIDAVTGTTSHEIMEASTDPYPTSNPAWAQVDNGHLDWEFVLGGGEVGDMCAQDPAAFTKFDGLDYVVQRIWSNKAANAGHDPCVPALPGEVYFNASPETIDQIPLNFGPGGSLLLDGVNIPVGSSKTIALDLFSDADTGGPWDVQVQDASGMAGGGQLGLSLDHASGQNGDKLQLTIKNERGSQYGVNIFFVTSSLGNNGHYWLGLVGSGSPSQLSSIAISPGNEVLLPYNSLRFTATGTYGDGSIQDLTSQVTWASSSPAVTLLKDSLFEALTPGTVTLTASLNGVTGSTMVTVQPK